MTRYHADGAWLRQQRTSISARAGGPSIDLIDITTELTGSPTLYGSSVTMMQLADLWNSTNLANFVGYMSQTPWISLLG